MEIKEDIVGYVAALAKLELTEEEKERAKIDLSNILGYMDRMKELDTDRIEPMSHAFPLCNVFREDEVLNGDDRENLLKNAPVQKDGCFVVPKTVE